MNVGVNKVERFSEEKAQCKSNCNIYTNSNKPTCTEVKFFGLRSLLGKAVFPFSYSFLSSNCSTKFLKASTFSLQRTLMCFRRTPMLKNFFKNQVFFKIPFFSPPHLFSQASASTLDLPEGISQHPKFLRCSIVSGHGVLSLYARQDMCFT